MVERQWMCFQFNNPSQVEIISSFLRAAQWQRVRVIGISLISCPNSEKYSQIALKSSRRRFKSIIGRQLKLKFYQLQYNWIYRKLVKSRVTNVACYNGLKGVERLVVSASKELSIPVLFFEDASLDGRMQIDWKGINFDSSVPRDINFYRGIDSKITTIDWKSLLPTARKVIKNPNVSQIKVANGALDNERYVFCPLQVAKDSQLTVHGGWIEGVHHFLECINELTMYLPSGMHFRIKEHPSSKVSYKKTICNFENSKIVLDNVTDTMDLIAQSTVVLTINSTVGLQAFYYGKPVITLGKAFYSFSELTAQAENLFQLSELIRDVEKIRFSEIERDMFMRFLYYWYPTYEDVCNGRITLKEINAQFSWLKDALGH